MQTSPQSPLREIRRRLGLSTMKFAQLCGASVASVNFAERGIGKLPWRIRERLDALEIDIEALQQAHERFRESRAQQILEEVLEEMEKSRRKAQPTNRDFPSAEASDCGDSTTHNGNIPQR